MRIFWDCEFTGSHQDTSPISIGFAAEDNRTFYAELTDYDKDQVDGWVQKNVIDRLFLPSRDEDWAAYDKTNNLTKAKGNLSFVTSILRIWLPEFHDPIEMWSDCLAYDWVLFCELFGGALSLPKNIYYIPFDISTLFKIKGIDPDINREEFVKEANIYKVNNRPDLWGKNLKHNALWDAEVIKACYEKLMTL